MKQTSFDFDLILTAPILPDITLIGTKMCLHELLGKTLFDKAMATPAALKQVFINVYVRPLTALCALALRST